MYRDRRFLATLLLALASGTLASAQDGPRRSTATKDVTSAFTKSGKLSPPVALDSLPAASRDQINRVMLAPTITATSPADEFCAASDLYMWLLDHPERVCLAWQRINIASIDIQAHQDGKFTWRDDQGSELTWRAVAANGEGRIWYAEGRVKPAALMPTVPVKAVAVLRHGLKKDDIGDPVICHQCEVYLQTDSKAASLVMRLLGPAAPRMAQEGAEQLLMFFSGIARYVDRHPTRAKALLAERK